MKGALRLRKKAHLHTSARLRGKRHARPIKRVETRNRFRFQNFGEQIESISWERIQGFGRSRTMAGSHLEAPSEGQSWFGMALGEWRELNLTSDFASFVTHVYGMSGSLAQLVYFRDAVLEALESHLLQDAPLAMAPLAALTAALVRDFGEELVPAFPRLFNALLEALKKTEEAETMQVVLGSMFFVVKSLLPEMDKFSMVSLLIDALLVKSVRPQVQDFMAEFLIYILSQHFESSLFEKIIAALGTNQEDLCACILAGSLVRKKSLSSDRLAQLAVEAAKSLTSTLLFKLLLSMIDRYGSEVSIACVAKVIPSIFSSSSSSTQTSLLLLAITLLGEHQRGRLLTGVDACSLLHSLVKLAPSAQVQGAIASVLGRASLQDVLPLRQNLRPFLADIRGVTLLLRSSASLLEPLLGGITAVQIILEQGEPESLVTVHLLRKVLAGYRDTPMASQVAARLPISRLRQNILNTSHFELAMASMSLLAELPSTVTDTSGPFEQFGQLCLGCPRHQTVQQWISLLHTGRNFIGAFVDRLNISSLHEHLSQIAVLEILDQVSPSAPLDPSLLKPLLVSSDSRRRLLTLTLLSREGQGRGSPSESTADATLLELCLHIEQIPWQFNSDREKGLAMQNLRLILKRLASERDHPPELELATRYLVGVLLMGFQPLRKDLYQALEILVNHHTALVRNILSETLTRLSHFEPAQDEDKIDATLVYVEVGDIREECSLVMTVKDSPMFGDTSVDPLIRFLAHKPQACDMLLETILPLCQRIFLSPPDGSFHLRNSWFGKRLQSSLSDLLTALTGAKSAKHHPHQLEIVRDILWRFLAFPDAPIQRHALSSILSLGLVDEVALYGERLRRLLDEKEIKEELVTLAAEQHSLMQVGTTWKALRSLLIPLLLGQLVRRRALGSSSSAAVLAIRRKVIINYVATWDAPSIHEFIAFSRPTLGEESEGKKLIGSLTLLATLIGKLGRRISEQTVSMLFSWFAQLADRAETMETDEATTVRNLLVKRLLDLYQVLSTEMTAILADEWQRITWRILEGRIDKLEREYVQQPSALLDLLHLWTCTPRYHCLLLPLTWTKLALALGVPKAHPVVLLKIVDIWVVALGQPALSRSLFSPTDSSLKDVLCQSLDSRIAVTLTDTTGRSSRLLERIVDFLLSLISCSETERTLLLPSKQDNDESSSVSAPALIPSARRLTIASALVRLLAHKGLRESIKVKMLNLLGNLYMDDLFESVKALAVDHLLDGLVSREARFALARLFQRLGQRSSAEQRSIGRFGQLFAELHASSAERIGEYDYERQGAAFSQLRQWLKDHPPHTDDGHVSEQSLLASCWIPSLKAMLYFCLPQRSPRRRRQGASSSARGGGEHEEPPELDPVSLNQALSIIRLFIERLSPGEAPTLMNLLVPALKRGLASEQEGVRVDSLSLLDALVTRFGETIPLLAPLRVLQGAGNDEVNFFLNVHHLQQHRRARALRRLAEWAQKTAPSSLSRSLLNDIFFPLLGHFIFPADPGAHGKSPVSSQVAHDAIHAMAILHALLPERLLLKRIMRYADQLRAGDGGPLREKALVRLITECLRQVPGSFKPSLTLPIIASLTSLLLTSSSSSSSGQRGGKGRKGTGKLRSSLALASAQLICKLPLDLATGHLSKLVSILATQLVHKLAPRRRDARNTLASIIALLPTEAMGALHMIIRELKATMTGGHLSHILAYVINQVLSTLSPTQTDAIASDVMPVILADMFGERAREKEAREWTGKIEEVKTRKSPDSLRLLVRALPLERLVDTVLRPLLDQLSEHAGELAWVEAASKALEAGLTERSSAAATAPMVPATAPQTLPKDHTDDVLMASLILVLLDDQQSPLYLQTTKPIRREAITCYQIIGARLWLHRLKQTNASVGPMEVAQLRPHLVRMIFGGSHSLLMATSIRCLARLSSLGHEVFDGEQEGSALLERLFGLILNSDAGKQTELVTAAFRLVTTLVRDCALTLAEGQLRVLLEYVRLHIETADTGAASIAHGLLRAILRRRVMLPELYELMTAVRRASLRSLNGSVRQQCRAAFLSFLLAYPLSRGRLEEHLNFYVANLAYEVDGGRESAAALLGSLADRWPHTTEVSAVAEVPTDAGNTSTEKEEESAMGLRSILLGELAETWIVALTARLMNEPSEGVRETVRDSLGRIIRRLDERIMGRLILLVRRWLAHDKEAIQLAAWHLLPLLIANATVSVTGLVNQLMMDEEGSLGRSLQAGELTREQLMTLEAISLVVSQSISPEQCNQLMMLKFGRDDRTMSLLRVQILGRLLEEKEKKHNRYLATLTGDEGAERGEAWAKRLIGDLRRLGGEEIVAILLRLSSSSLDECPSPLAIFIVNKLERVHRQETTNEEFTMSLCKYFAGFLLHHWNSMGDATEEHQHRQIVSESILQAILRIEPQASEALRLVAQQVRDLLATQMGREAYEELLAQVQRKTSLGKRKRQSEQKREVLVNPQKYARRQLQQGQRQKRYKLG